MLEPGASTVVKRSQAPALHLEQESALLRRALPAVLDADPAAVRRAEAADVEGVAECMLGNLGVGVAVHATAGIGRHLADGDDGLAEPRQRRRLHHVLHPHVHLVDHRAGELAGRLQHHIPLRQRAHAERVVHAAGAGALDGGKRLHEDGRDHSLGRKALLLGLGAPRIALLQAEATAREGAGQKEEGEEDAGRVARHGPTLRRPPCKGVKARRQIPQKEPQPLEKTEPHALPLRDIAAEGWGSQAGENERRPAERPVGTLESGAAEPGAV